MSASRMALPTHVSGITVSTRSNPVDGYVVERDVGIAIGNSRSFQITAHSDREADEVNAINEAMAMASQTCRDLGGNAILALSIEIKQFGQHGSLIVVQVTGTACVVSAAKRG